MDGSLTSDSLHHVGVHFFLELEGNIKEVIAPAYSNVQQKILTKDPGLEEGKIHDSS